MRGSSRKWATPANDAMTQRAIPAVYMRGGTSKGVFFRREDLPADAAARDRILLRVIGSPDAYGKQIDGMGGATSSTSKVVLVAKSARADCDVDFLFGAVAIDEPVIDWSGNCGNLTAAVGPFAIDQGIVETMRDGMQPVRIWQENIGKRIVAHVPVQDGRAVEEGGYVLDGVSFPAAEIRIEFLDPGGGGGTALLPTGCTRDVVDIGEGEPVHATLVNAGNPTVVVAAASLGLRGTEMQADVNADAALLARCERIRAHAAVTMGLAGSAEEATRKRPATPKLAFVAPPAAYRAASGRQVSAQDIDLTARILSMGQLHHALTGTGAIALAVAARLPGTLVHAAAAPQAPGAPLRIGHPSGVLLAGAEVREHDGHWQVAKVVVSRSARRLMAGQVFIPAT
jgi:2-methylaconitate isomerase